MFHSNRELVILVYLIVLTEASPLRRPRESSPEAKLSLDLIHEKREDCQDPTSSNNHQSISGENLSPKVIVCLNNCANCVKQWRNGVYNGRNCANDCMEQQKDQEDSISLAESMDPDCNLIKYFNSTLLASVR